MPQLCAITPGDPAGIGPHVMAQALKATIDKYPQIGRVVLGPREMWMRAGLEPAHNLHFDSDVFSEPLPTPGQPSEAASRIALAALQHAAEKLRTGEYNGVVTGPISKQHMQRIGFSYPGHTEFLAATAKTDTFAMAFRGARLNVLLVTIHEPLQTALGMLNSQLVERAIRLSASHAWQMGLNEPDILVAGINPHAGESGYLGDQELKWLNPLCARLRDEGLPVYGTFPPDTVFHEAVNTWPRPCIVVAMYHDQGLIPFKLLHFDDGVNVTLGLPFVRTSPDHGTAFGLAAQLSNPAAGRARISAASATAALELALQSIAAKNAGI